MAVSVHAPCINPARVTAMLAEPLAVRRLARLRGLFSGKHIILGVDELEPTRVRGCPRAPLV